MISKSEPQQTRTTLTGPVISTGSGGRYTTAFAGGTYLVVVVAIGAP